MRRTKLAKKPGWDKKPWPGHPVDWSYLARLLQGQGKG